MFFESYILILFLLIILFIIINKISQKNKLEDFSDISEKSFQRYSKFYGEVVLHDENFEKKIKKIYQLIINNKETDITRIAELSNCDYHECISKIKYLKHKRKIGDYYIDALNKEIKPCNKEERLLIKKYYPYIYVHHYQIDEIAKKLPYATIDNLEEIEEQVLNELDYLDKKNLINGINIDRVDKKIIYYTIEKQKKEKDYISLNCPNCGALNDVPRTGKARCEYCETIVEDINEN